jgi:hypothetical protein
MAKSKCTKGQTTIYKTYTRTVLRYQMRFQKLLKKQTKEKNSKRKHNDLQNKESKRFNNTN